MIRINCPWCGLRNESEFSYCGDATIERPADDAPMDAWYDYVYSRENPRGAHAEYWQHVQGCRALVKVVRDTFSHAILNTEPAPALEQSS